MKGAQESQQGRRQLKKTEKKKKKRSLIHVFSFSTVFVTIITNCFIIFSSVSGNVFANHVLLLPYRNCK